MKEVCQKHGALLILDEVMCGMGRTGTLHAWEQEDVTPDLQTVAKGLGGGYAPIAALLVNRRVVDTLSQGSGAFSHSQTYQGHPVSCAAACKVQKIIRDDHLLANVREMGEYLGQLLHETFDKYAHVGDIRGRGLFWAVSGIYKLSRFISIVKKADRIFRLSLSWIKRPNRLIRLRKRLPGRYTKPLWNRSIQFRCCPEVEVLTVSTATIFALRLLIIVPGTRYT